MTSDLAQAAMYNLRSQAADDLPPGCLPVPLHFGRSQAGDIPSCDMHVMVCPRIPCLSFDVAVLGEESDVRAHVFVIS